MSLFSRATGFVSRAANVVQEQVQAAVPSGEEAAHAVITANIAANPALATIDALTGAGSHYLDQSTAQVIVGSEAALASGVTAGVIGAAALSPIFGTTGGTVGGVAASPAGARVGVEGTTELFGQVGQPPLMSLDEGYTATEGASPGATAPNVSQTLGTTGGKPMSDIIVSDTQLVEGSGSNPTQNRTLGDDLLNLFGLARTTTNQTQPTDNRPATYDLGGTIIGAIRHLFGAQDQATQPKTTGTGWSLLTWVIVGVAIVGGGYLLFRSRK